MPLANNLKKARQEANLSQAELADKLGLNVRTYGSYERGERDVNTELLRTICQVLNVSADELLDIKLHKVRKREFTVEDFVKENEGYIIVEVEEAEKIEPNDDYVRHLIYRGRLDGIPYNLLKRKVLYTGWHIIAQCFFIIIL